MVREMTDVENLKKKAKDVLSEKVKYYANIMDVSYGKVTIRHQRTRWGSCSDKGNLNFNCLLMMTPERIQNYVVVHELAHRKEMNHSKKFWEVVESILPDYRESVKWLKTDGLVLIQKMDV